MQRDVKINFSDHASYQMRNRKIAKHEIEKCIYASQGQRKQEENRYQAIRRIDTHHALVVIYIDEGNTYKIITAFITSKLKKYL